MLSLEEKLWKWIEKYVHLLFFIVITGIAAFVRMEGRSFVSADAETYLLPWYETIKEQGGFHALSGQVGDYSILYQTVVAIMTYIPMHPLTIHKLLSTGFDFLLAFSGAFFVADVKKEKIFGSSFNLVYTCIILLPTVVFNSVFWAQCDSIFVTFIILTLYFLYKEKYLAAFVMLGIAFAFKLQTIFILPFILCYYFYKKKFSIMMCIVSIFTFWISGIAAFVNGRSLLAPFTIYAEQIHSNQRMWQNFPSFWLIVGDNYEYLNSFAIMLTIAILGVGLLYVLSEKKEMNTPEQFMNSACWGAWTCILFLPAMQERYSYLLDILLILLCFTNKKYVKFAVPSCIMSTMICGNYLFANGEIEKIFGILYFWMWLYFTWTLHGERKEILREAK